MRGNVEGDGVFRIGGEANTTEKIIEWSVSGSASLDPVKVRWRTLMNKQTESGDNAGSNIMFTRFSDTGEALGHALFLERRTGRVGFSTLAGPVSGPTDLAPALLTAKWQPAAGHGMFGLWIEPRDTIGTGGGAIVTRLRTAADLSLRTLVAGTTNYLFNLRADGQLSWGNGTDATDAFLRRESAAFLRTDASLRVDRNFLVGTTSSGSGMGVVAMGNATTVPQVNPTNGGVMYVQNGALKYRGSNGTVTTLAAA